MMQLASLTNDSGIDCTPELLEDQTDMRNKNELDFFFGGGGSGCVSQLFSMQRNKSVCSFLTDICDLETIKNFSLWTSNRQLEIQMEKPKSFQIWIIIKHYKGLYMHQYLVMVKE